MSTENSCALTLDHLVFDELTFKREGFQSSSELQLEFGFRFKDDADGSFITSIRVIGEKEGEYRFTVCASGYFQIGEDTPDRSVFVQQNASAIIFPYIRSQISLLTAQPGMEPVVLPPMNIALLVADAKQNSQN